MLKNQIAVIDSQDALIGNRAYDLASLDDVRFKTSNNLKDKIYDYYLKQIKRLMKKNLKWFWNIIGLKKFKIIGIFTRLAIRDNKKNI